MIQTTLHRFAKFLFDSNNQPNCQVLCGCTTFEMWTLWTDLETTGTRVHWSFDWTIHWMRCYSVTRSGIEHCLYPQPMYTLSSGDRQQIRLRYHHPVQPDYVQHFRCCAASICLLSAWICARLAYRHSSPSMAWLCCIHATRAHINLMTATSNPWSLQQIDNLIFHLVESFCHFTIHHGVATPYLWNICWLNEAKRQIRERRWFHLEIYFVMRKCSNVVMTLSSSSSHHPTIKSKHLWIKKKNLGHPATLK